VASEAAGAAKAMIDHEKNGLLFTPGDFERLADLLMQLHHDKPLCHRLAAAGQRTITDSWCPRVAAERVLSVSEAILCRRPSPLYETGPMSLIG